jgi:GAF domain-containing protein
MARELTGARYAALAVLNEQRDGLEQFWTAGVDEDTRRAIGHLPRGRGTLGELILRPRPLRVADVSRHPGCYGFPSGHPVMRSFLGVPIMILGQAWGSLHVADKADGDFTEADERATVALAQEAANTLGFERGVGAGRQAS